MADTSGSSPLIAGRYRVGRRLGRGGMADVFDAFDERLERPVAVKALRPEVAVDATMRQRFAGEARAAARLSHPCVVAVYDSGEHAGRAFLVMERLPGETLADVIARGPVPPSQLRPIGADILAALGAAHALGIIHRDIKPGNVLLTEEGRAKVADFGIAKLAEPGPADTGDLTGVGLVLGTPAYLAPERLAGQPATVATDLYAAGVVLYEAATGHKPPPGGLDATVAGEAGAAGVAAMPGIDPGIAAVIRRAMAPRAQDRYPSASAMADDLEAGGLTAMAAAAAPTVAQTASPTQVLAPTAAAPPAEVEPVAEAVEEEHRRRGWAWLVALLLLAVVVVVIIALLASHHGGGGSTPTTTASTVPASTTAPAASTPSTTAAPTTTTTTPPSTTSTTAAPTTTTTVRPTTTTTARATTTTRLTTTTTRSPTTTSTRGAGPGAPPRP